GLAVHRHRRASPMKLFDWLKHDPMGDFEDGADLNTRNKRRNIIVFSSLASVVMLIIAAAVVYNKSASSAEVIADEAKPIDFGAVIDTEFTAKDNQSALSAQQVTLTSLQKTIDDLAKAVKNHGDSNESFRQTVKREQEAIAKGIASQMAYLEETLTEKMQSTPLPKQASTVTSDEVKRGRYLGQSQAAPFQPTNYGALEKSGGNSNNSQRIGGQGGIDHVSLTWANDETTVRKRTIENYVPSGTV
ncbi:conjugal transfer protein TraB, partial [Photobacterium frigidiphilum]